jgi:hypothetical protein
VVGEAVLACTGTARGRVAAGIVLAGSCSDRFVILVKLILRSVAVINEQAILALNYQVIDIIHRLAVKDKSYFILIVS